jgi:hypothetical protein
MIDAHIHVNFTRRGKRHADCKNRALDSHCIASQVGIIVARLDDGQVQQALMFDDVGVQQALKLQIPQAGQAVRHCRARKHWQASLQHPPAPAVY